MNAFGFYLSVQSNNYQRSKKSLVGFVIQATGMEEFNDGLWIGNQLKAKNALQMVRTNPRTLLGSVYTENALEVD